MLVVAVAPLVSRSWPLFSPASQVTSFDGARTHHVAYDDGDEADYDMREERYELLEDEPRKPKRRRKAAADDEDEYADSDGGAAPPRRAPKKPKKTPKPKKPSLEVVLVATERAPARYT